MEFPFSEKLGEWGRGSPLWLESVEMRVFRRRNWRFIKFFVLYFAKMLKAAMKIGFRKGIGSDFFFKKNGVIVIGGGSNAFFGQDAPGQGF